MSRVSKLIQELEGRQKAALQNRVRELFEPVTVAGRRTLPDLTAKGYDRNGHRYMVGMKIREEFDKLLAENVEKYRGTVEIPEYVRVIRPIYPKSWYPANGKRTQHVRHKGSRRAKAPVFDYLLSNIQK